MVVKVKKNWNIKVSKETIKRIIKKARMTWKRIKKQVNKTPFEWELEVKMPLIKKLKEQEKNGEIDLRYLDESGFNLQPNIPYCWQGIEKVIKVKSSSSKRLNVIGIMNRNNELYSEIHTGKVTSDIIINCLDNFSQNLSKKTVILMDQASIHTSDKLLGKLSEWKKRNLEIVWLPADEIAIQK